MTTDQTNTPTETPDTPVETPATEAPVNEAPAPEATSEGDLPPGQATADVPGDVLGI